MKKCNKCGEEKGLEGFYNHPTQKDGYFSVCKSCYIKRESLKRRLKVGFASLKPDYCECCGASDMKIDLDHCHDTGMFRGFICRPCNKRIGIMGDTHESLKFLDAEQQYLDYLKLANYRMGKIV